MTDDHVCNTRCAADHTPYDPHHELVGVLIRERDNLRAEVEQLKRAHSQTIGELVETGEMLEKASAEIRRLENRLDEAATLWAEDLRDKDEEIDRLRAELDSGRADHGQAAQAAPEPAADS